MQGQAGGWRVEGGGAGGLAGGRVLRWEGRVGWRVLGMAERVACCMTGVGPSVYRHEGCCGSSVCSCCGPERCAREGIGQGGEAGGCIGSCAF